MKEFVTAVRTAEEESSEERIGVQFKVDGQVCTAYKPEPEQYALFVAMTGRYSTLSDKLAGIIDMFVMTLDEKSNHYLVAKLMDRNDRFGLDEVEGIMRWLVEQWSGKDSDEQSASTKQPQPTGA